MQNPEYLVQVLQHQRNQAMDQLAVTSAGLIAAQKRIAELEAEQKRIAELEAEQRKPKGKS
jgi:hypothetical protein